MSNPAKNDSKPESWRAKFREWGSIGGKAASRAAKVAAAKKSWAPGGGNFKRRRKTKVKRASTAPQKPAETVEQALREIAEA